MSDRGKGIKFLSNIFKTLKILLLVIQVRLTQFCINQVLGHQGIDFSNSCLLQNNKERQGFFAAYYNIKSLSFHLF